MRKLRLTKKTKWIAWTGGLDSTYLILKNLREGHNVIASSVLFLNNESQTLSEYIAREKLTLMFEKIAFENKCTFEYSHLDSSKWLAGNSSYILGQLPMLTTLFRYSCPYYKDVDFAEFAYVKGDCIFEPDYNFEKLFTDNFNNFEKYNNNTKKKVKLVFPLRDTTKEEIIANMPQEMLDVISFCESPPIKSYSKEYNEVFSIISSNKHVELDRVEALFYKRDNCSCLSCERMKNIYTPKIDNELKNLASQLEDMFGNDYQEDVFLSVDYKI